MSDAIPCTNTDLEIDSLDYSLFTPAELFFIASAVTKYINTPNIAELKDSIVKKIQKELAWRHSWGSYHRIQRPVTQEAASTNSLAVKIAGGSPIFKFITCPEQLVLSEIPYYSCYYVSDTSYPISFEWNPSEFRNYITPGPGKGCTAIKLSAGDKPILLRDIEIELLTAFYIYHSLRERGVEMSGLPLTAPSSEGESEG